jgi:hypothetical protein
MQIWLPTQPHDTTYFLTVSTTIYSDHKSIERVSTTKKIMLNDAQNSIAQLLHEIQHHWFPKYPTKQKLIQPKTKLKLAANREIPRTRGSGEKNKVTANTTSKKLRLPI